MCKCHNQAGHHACHVSFYWTECIVMSDCVSQVRQELNNRIKRAVEKVRSRHWLRPASGLMSDSPRIWSQPGHATAQPGHTAPTSWPCQAVCPDAQPMVFPCCYAMSTLPPWFPQACFPFPRFCFKSPPAPTLHLIVFSYPARFSLTPKLLVSISKPWSCSCCLPLSQAPYLDFCLCLHQWTQGCFLVPMS